jgi:hypothetical protein
LKKLAGKKYLGKEDILKELTASLGARLGNARGSAPKENGGGGHTAPSRRRWNQLLAGSSY